MRISNETKFGYGFLLVGWGMPYLIDRLAGPTLALIFAIICTVLGIYFLIAGSLHQDAKDTKGRKWNIVSAVRLLSAVVLLGLGWWSIYHFANKQRAEETIAVFIREGASVREACRSGEFGAANSKADAWVSKVSGWVSSNMGPELGSRFDAATFDDGEVMSHQKAGPAQSPWNPVQDRCWHKMDAKINALGDISKEMSRK